MLGLAAYLICTEQSKEKVFYFDKSIMCTSEGYCCTFIIIIV